MLTINTLTIDIPIIAQAIISTANDGYATYDGLIKKGTRHVSKQGNHGITSGYYDST